MQNLLRLMNPHVAALFEFTRARVSEEHIANFSPSDPGYQSYVRLWTGIYRDGVIPAISHFDLSEVIGLTGWVKIKYESDPIRFREYRRFTSAVAVALIHFGNDSESVRRPNYLARDLVIDCDRLEPEHFELVRNVLPITRDVLTATNDEEGYPYFTFAALILAQRANHHDEAVRLAAELIAEESAVRNDESLNYWSREDSRFLLGLTIFNQLHNDWIRLARELSNPTRDENTQLIIEAFAEAKR
ncbi:MAG: hypothetical protein NXI22_04860 [bacterium]|nr:hypothetical protein [bacterium]